MEKKERECSWRATHRRPETGLLPPEMLAHEKRKIATICEKKKGMYSEHESGKECLSVLSGGRAYRRCE